MVFVLRLSTEVKNTTMKAPGRGLCMVTIGFLASLASADRLPAGHAGQGVLFAAPPGARLEYGRVTQPLIGPLCRT